MKAPHMPPKEDPGLSVARPDARGAKLLTEGSDLRPTFHELKTWARYFDAVADGRKTFEVRKNDRAFQTGDFIDLVKVENEYPHCYVNQPGKRFSKITLRRRITYVLQGGQFGIEAGFCVLGLGAAGNDRTRDAPLLNTSEVDEKR